jgi:hypothetical protein
MKTFATRFLFLLALAPLVAEAQPTSKDTEIPYQQRFVLQFANGESSKWIVTDPDESVPPNMRLTIRNVNYLLNVDGGQTARCYLARFLDPLFALTVPTSWHNYPIGSRVGSGNFQTELVLDEGDFEIICSRTGNLGTANTRITLTGVLTRDR